MILRFFTDFAPTLVRRQNEGSKEAGQRNDKNNAEEIKQRYGTETGPSYFFVDKDGTILGRIRDTDKLQEAIDKYFKL